MAVIRLQLFAPLFLLMLLAGCGRMAVVPPTLTAAPSLEAAPSSTATAAPIATAIATQTPAPSATSSPTRKPTEPKPTATLTATPELLACHADPASLVEAPNPVLLLYANDDKVFSWDEASGATRQLPLPEDAGGPVISDDGRYAAFVTQGQSVDTPGKPVESISVRLFDTQTGMVSEAGRFSTVEVRATYPDSPQIFLKMEWLPGGHRLLVQVYPYPWGTGILQPTGPLHLLDADTGSKRLVLEGGAYELYSIRPDGMQIAALDTQAISTAGVFDEAQFQQATLHLIDAASATITRSIPVRLPSNIWSFHNPVYTPDGSKLALNTENGIAILDVQQGVMVEAPLTNTCLEGNECYWIDALPILWLPDSGSFYTMQSINDYYDQRAETTLSRVYVDGGLRVETEQVIHANQTMSFSPDRGVMAYWNQPDIDTLEQGAGSMNWITLYLMDLEEKEPKRYTDQYLLRVKQWHADNRRFLFSYSPRGGPNPVPSQLALGDICQTPRDLPGLEEGFVDRVRWLHGERFLAWSLPSSGIPNQYQSGLYLYDLAQGGAPVHIADLLQNIEDPYGYQMQVVVLQD